MTALTFVRGRTEVAITESGSPAAEAGQFTVHRSRSIRAATSDRVQVDVVGATPTSGGALLYFDPDNASSGGSQSSYGRVMSWLDPATTGALTLSGNEITDAIRAASASGDGLTPPAGMGFYAAATNYEPNGGYETNVTGWSGLGGAVLTRVTTKYKFGSVSAQLVCAASSDGIQSSAPYGAFTGGIAHTMSAWVFADVGETVTVQWNEYDAGGAYLGLAHSANVTGNGAWQKAEITATANASFSKVALFAYSASGAQTFYVDGVQFEPGGFATPYIETNGSTASRSAARGRIDTSLLSSTQGFFAGRVRMGWANTARTGTDDGYLFWWTLDGSNYIFVGYDVSDAKWYCTRSSSGGADIAGVADTFSAGDDVTVIAKWDATTAAISIDGAAFTSSGTGYIPLLASILTADIGSNGSSGNYVSGNVRWMVLGTGTLTNADATLIHAFGNTPPTVSALLAGLSASAGPVILWDAVTSSYTVLPTAGIECWYDKANTAFKARRFTSGAGAIVSATATFAAGAATMIYVAWDATTLYLSVNGATIQTAANTTIPTIAATTFDVGSYGGAAQYLNAAFGAVVELTAPISADQLAILAALRAERPPAPREAIEAKMAGLWYGGHTISWDFTASDCDGIDLLNTAGVKVRETDGLGGAPVQNRIVETPLRDGASYVDTRLQPRIVRLPLAVYDEDSQADWYTLRRTLLAAFNPLPGPGVLTFAPSATLYEATAIYDSGLEYSQRAGTYLQRSPLALLCHDPAWRVAVAVEGEGTVPREGWSIPWSIPWSITSAEVDVTVTSASDDGLDTYPVFEFTAGTAGSTGLTIANTTTGETLAFGTGLALAAGEVVTIDMGERTATKADGTNVIGYREAGSVMWALQAGANTVNVSVDTGDGTIRVRHYTRLIGI